MLGFFIILLRRYTYKYRLYKYMLALNKVSSLWTSGRYSRTLIARFTRRYSALR